MHHRFFLGGTLAIGALMLSACSSGHRQFEVRAAGQGAAPLQSDAEMVQAARQHLGAEQYGLAIGQFRALLIRDPDSAFAHNGLAVAYDAIGRADLARRHFERALALAPQSPTYARNVARLASRDAELKAQASRQEQAQLGDPAPEVYRLRLASIGGASAASSRHWSGDAASAFVSAGQGGVALVTRHAPFTSADMRASSMPGDHLSMGTPLPFTLERVRTGALLAAGYSPVLERVSHYEVRIVSREAGDRLVANAKPAGPAPAGVKRLWHAVSQVRSDLKLALQTTARQLACQRSHAQSSTSITGLIWMNQRCVS